MGTSFAAIVLAGGRAERMGGVDKAAARIAGRSLLEHVLDAVAAATQVVVVGPVAPTDRPVAFTREEPAGGGPAAGLLAGRDAVPAADLLVVVAVDMPKVTEATVRRLLSAAAGHDGAFLVDSQGHRQLAGVLQAASLDAVAPAPAERRNLPLHRLLAPLDLVDVASVGDEARDVDTWTDLAQLRD